MLQAMVKLDEASPFVIPLLSVFEERCIFNEAMSIAILDFQHESILNLLFFLLHLISCRSFRGLLLLASRALALLDLLLTSFPKLRVADAPFNHL